MSTKTVPARARHAASGFKIGEKVMVQYDATRIGNRELHGQLMTFLGYEWEASAGRWWSGGRSMYPRPGIYLDPRYAVLGLEDGKETTEYDGYLQLPDPVLEKARQQVIRNEAPVFLRDLPDLPFWEGDYVTTKSSRLWGCEKGKTLVVVNIDHHYSHIPNYPLYHVSDELVGSGWSSPMRADELVRVKRGNVWNHYHGLPLTFSSKEEEMEFLPGLTFADNSTK